MLGESTMAIGGKDPSHTTATTTARAATAPTRAGVALVMPSG